MDAVTPGLYASPPEPSPFGPSLEIRAFSYHRATEERESEPIRGR
jgi:hypothetical protein